MNCIDCKKQISKHSKRCQSCCKKGKLHPLFGMCTKVSHTCDICKKEFNVTFSKRNTSKYCSLKCLYIGLKKQVKKICKSCGKEFEVKLSRAKESKFCSFSCKFPNRNKKFEKRCKICQKVFIKPQNRSLGEWFSKTKYCSLKCGWRSKLGKIGPNKGKTYEESFGIEKALDIKKRVGIGSKGRISWNKGKNKFIDSRVASTARKLKGHLVSEFTRKKISENVKRGLTPERIKRSLKFKVPNKDESHLNKLLKINFPHEWKFVGDGKVIIEKKNPDFININGKKQIIEMYGTYWHKPEEVQPRIDTFAKYGYKTLVVWDYELDDETKVIERVKNLSS